MLLNKICILKTLYPCFSTIVTEPNRHTKFKKNQYENNVSVIHAKTTSVVNGSVVYELKPLT